MLRLTFLGTSGAMPTAARNLSGLSVRHGREHFLLDCGEGTQRQMIRYGTGFDVSAIFFTHFHADHYVGAIGFVRTLSMLGRERPLDVYGPAPARPRRARLRRVRALRRPVGTPRWTRSQTHKGDSLL